MMIYKWWHQLKHQRGVCMCFTFGLVPPQCAVSSKGNEPWPQEKVLLLHHCLVPCCHPAEAHTKHYIYGQQIKGDISKTMTTWRQYEGPGQACYNTVVARADELTSTIWFSGLMSWTWGTVMLTGLPCESVCWAQARTKGQARITLNYQQSS